MIMKKTLLEIIGIIVVSALIGLFYNLFSEKPIPLIPKTKEELTVSDSLLEKLITDTGDSESHTFSASNNINQKSLDNSKNLQDTVSFSTKGGKNVTPLIAENQPAQLTKEKTDNESNKEQSEKKEVKFVNYDHILKYLNNQRVIFIDARNPEDYAKSHIGNAINIFPWKNGEPYIDNQRIVQLPRNKIYIVYCMGGTCDDSHTIAQTLLDMGFDNVFVYKEGWDEWNIKNKH
jgi:rhodanese-related sulfurtransferase